MRETPAHILNSEFEAIYAGLRARALQLVRRECRAQSMSPTMLVHEAYLVLTRGRGIEVRDRGHLTRVVGRVMRNLLIDRARARKALINGGALRQVDLCESLIRTEADADVILAVATALNQLAASAPNLARLVELRFFGGFTEEETGALTGMSARTVKRQWRVAKARLMELMELESSPLESTQGALAA